MKASFEKIRLAIILVLLSTILYLIHYTIFKDSHHIIIYLIGDIAFLPLEIFFVSLIFDKIIEDKEKKKVYKKLSMVIGAFFSEVGTHLLDLISSSDENIENIRDKMIIGNDWTNKSFDNSYSFAKKHVPNSN